MVQVLFGMVLPWLLVGVGCWLVLELIRQNGRILVRLEAIEERLENVGTAAPAPGGMAADEPSGLAPGTPAPAFQLADLDGKQHSLAQYKGKRVLLVFFSPRCGFCTEMLEDLAALPLNGSTATPMPLVVTVGTVEENRTLFPAGKFKFPILLQKQGEVSAQYQAYGTPIGYLIDETGTIASTMTAGAQGLVELARNGPSAAAAAVDGTCGGGSAKAGAKPARGNKSLSESRLVRDGLKAGTPAPLFRLPKVEGGDMSLADFRGRKVLLVFSDPECGPCSALNPELERIHRDLPELRVVMVSRRDREANRKKVAEYGLTFPVVIQKNWDTSRLYGMFATPIAYLIDERGTIAANVAVGADAILGLVPGRAAALAPARAVEV